MGRSGVMNPIEMMGGVGVEVGVGISMGLYGGGSLYDDNRYTTLYDGTSTIVYLFILIFQF